MTHNYCCPPGQRADERGCMKKGTQLIAKLCRLVPVLCLISVPAAANAIKCGPCINGSHVENVYSTTTVDDYRTVDSAHVENGPNQTSTQSAECRSQFSNKKKYTLSGSLTAADFGLSADYEKEMTSGDECSYRAQVDKACSCARGVCQNVYEVKTITKWWCDAHMVTVLIWTDTCECAEFGTKDGTLETLKGKNCTSQPPHTIAGCGA